jgi:hypothetical protein
MAFPREFLLREKQLDHGVGFIFPLPTVEILKLSSLNKATKRALVLVIDASVVAAASHCMASATGLVTIHGWSGCCPSEKSDLQPGRDAGKRSIELKHRNIKYIKACLAPHFRASV